MRTTRCRVLVAQVLLCLLAGCTNTIDSFYNRPVTEDQLITDRTGAQELGILAVTAQRRVIVGNLKTGHFCSEPPPEAADEVTSAVAAALTAKIGPNKNVNAELASSLARHINQLYKRAHTIQLFRDASFHLCVDAVNNANDGEPMPKTNQQVQQGANATQYESYKASVLELIDTLKSSLEKEIELYYQTEIARAKHGIEPVKEIIVCSASAEGADGKSATVTCRPASAPEQSAEKVTTAAGH